MKHIKDFNESNEEPKKELTVRVKHLIAYLQKLDPEIDVQLDHDGWMAQFSDAKDEVELIENRGLFDVFKSRDGVDHLIINN